MQNNVETAREAAEKLLKEKGLDALEMRSCWNCNPAHEHLKSRELIWCFECGHYFYKGIDITEE